MRPDWPDRNFAVIATEFETVRPLTLQLLDDGKWRNWESVGPLGDFKKDVENALFSCRMWPHCRLVEAVGYITEDNARDKAARILQVLRNSKQMLSMMDIAELSNTHINFVMYLIIGIEKFNIGYDIQWGCGRYTVRKLKPKLTPAGR